MAKNFPVLISRYIALIAMASQTEHHEGQTGAIPWAPVDRPIVLVGMMGVGKSSIGKKLANRLNLQFVDADDAIETAAGMNIAEIFNRFGEPYFRDGERRVIARLIDGPPKVIATGGGAFINPETRALILQKARSIWLDADINVLVERVGRRNHRPLLQGRNALEVLTELGQVRNPIYAEATIHIRSDTSPHARTVENILKALAQ
jgi:shikimate kinase